MKKKVSVKIRNSMYPGYSACSKCGGNWGWKKYTCHDTSEHSGLFLFCKECDKIITPEERWKALDEWKKSCIKEIMGGRESLLDLIQAVSNIEHTEFVEFPRLKKGG